MAIGRSEAVGILREWGVLLCKMILSLYLSSMAIVYNM